MTKREDQARDYAAEQGWKYVKVYGSQGDSVCPYITGTVTRYCTLAPFTLTDEEREAVEYFVRWGTWESAAGYLATLRGLLDRTSTGEKCQ